MSESKPLTPIKQRTLSRLLLGYFAVSIFVVVVSASIATAWQTSEKIKLSTIERGMQLTSNFADQVVLALLTESVENAQESVDWAVGFRSVIGVAVLKVSGEPLFSSVQHVNALKFDEIDTAEPGVRLTAEIGNVWIYSAPVFFANEDFGADMAEPDLELVSKEIVGHVVLEYNKDELFEIQRSIFVNNISIGSIAGLILTFVMHIVIKRQTAPLSSLAETMELARDSGNYVKADVSGTLELQRMAQSYNQMMSKLEEQNQVLASHRNTLESEVRIRTQELKVARDSALTASRHKSEFLANISHELRTPLQAIIGYTDLVIEELELEAMDAQVDDLNKGMRSAQSLLELINNILDIAKIEAGKMDVYRQQVDMAGLIQETIDNINPMAKANNNRLVVKHECLSDYLKLDRQKTKQIFLNLLSNACKFTKEGDIVFRLSNDNEFFEFSIRDTGAGIPKEQLKSIFEPFTQVDGSRTRKFEGSGLGMAITRSFCDLMGATINVTSKVDVGTEFTVRLPVL